MKEEILNRYQQWLQKANRDNLQDDLKALKEDEKVLEEAFYMSLEFGTAGLRGILGAGTNRMNVYTVGTASQGLAQWVLGSSLPKRIAISYDSRHKSELFARESAAIFAMNGIEVVIYSELMPTPMLSYAVRYFNCAAGVMVTASHNPAKYNGYKVYGPDGCQMTSESAGQVYRIIQSLDLFEDTKWGDFDSLVNEGKISFIGEDPITSYIEEVKKQSPLSSEDSVNKDVSIVYTPLYGAGYKPVMRILKETGFTNITVVEEQKNPNGDFPTCPYPNPEIAETLSLGVEYCKKFGADLLIATDPDSDRVAIAVKDGENYRIFSGNETGCLLLDFVLSMRKKNGTLPEDAVTVKSIVTTDLAAEIAASYGVEMRNVLTGFKYIGEQILRLEEKKEENRYVFGFEESCGYLSGTYARDKDAVNGALLIAEMFSYYKTKGISLIDRLNQLGEKFGYFANGVHQKEYDGIAGKARMKEISDAFRNEIFKIGDLTIEKKIDYLAGVDGLPKADVLKLLLSDGSAVIVRPSGTEPKMKFYITAKAESEKKAKEKEAEIFKETEKFA